MTHLDPWDFRECRETCLIHLVETFQAAVGLQGVAARGGQGVSLVLPVKRQDGRKGWDVQEGEEEEV